MSVSLPAAAETPDLIALYLDREYTTNKSEIDTTPTTVTGYLVLLNPSASGGVAGWETKVGIEGPAFLAGASLEGRAINVLSPPNFMVGLSNPPLPGGDKVLLAIFTFFVTDQLPVAISLLPSYPSSLPDQLSYLNAKDLLEIIPLQTVTGQARVAFLNWDDAYCEVSTDHLVLGDTVPGSTLEQSFAVANPGMTDIYLDIGFTSECPEFSLPGLRGQVVVAPGNQIAVPVRFSAATVGAFECVLAVGSSCGEITVSALVREPLVAWEAPDTLDFGETVVQTPSSRTVLLKNTGETDLPITWSPPDSPAFGCTPATATSFTLSPGQQWGGAVSFTAPALGSYESTIGLGAVLSPITLLGVGREGIVSWRIRPDPIELPTAVIGTHTSRIVELVNDGEMDLDLDLALAGTDSAFSIRQDAAWLLRTGPQVFEPGQSGLIEIVFEPRSEGGHGEQLLLGGPIPPVAVTGLAEAADPRCTLTPAEAVFDSIPAGSSAVRVVRLSNDGNLPIHLDPFDDSPCFTLSAPTLTVSPGEAIDLRVYFLPVVEGEWSATIDLGANVCADLPCSGRSTWIPDDDENLLGVYFEPTYTNSSVTVADNQSITAYAVLKACTSVLGVSGWECRFLIDGEFVNYGWNLAGAGQNTLVPPEYKVGLSAPMPYSPGGILLATARVTVLNRETPIVISLYPVGAPSLPGRMSWLTGDHQQLRAMSPITGAPAVAWINAAASTGSASPPAADATIDGVLLRCVAPAGPYDACRVLRRGGSGETAVVGEAPLKAAGGLLVFTDPVDGVEPGTTLYYSMALLRNGVERARSAETAVALPGAPAAATRLLPNVPNPFNPRTEVRFELGRPGRVRVTIFDLTGRRIRTLMDEDMAAGPHARTWPGDDDAGRRVASGTYTIRLQAGGRTDQRKVLLLK